MNNLDTKTNEEIHDQLHSEYISLAKVAKADLKGMVKRSHRVIDLRECSKDMLVTMILEARHGRRKLDIAFCS